MDNEQLMLSLFKKQQYRITRAKLQKIFMIVSAASSVFAIILTILIYSNAWYVFVFLGALVFVSINALLIWLSVLRLQTAAFITMLYNCFVFIPSLWLITGIFGAAPLVSLIMLVAIITLFSGRMLKGMLIGFSTAMLALTVYSTLIELPLADNTIHLVYLIAAYMTTFVTIVVYMLFKQREFDELNDRFLRSSFKDELTQLYNRKLLEIIVEYQESLYIKNQTDYIFVMIDVDNFKEMNDEHGHIYGDIVLRSIAKCIQDKARTSDFIVRYGGDEFLVIQTNASDVSIKLFIKRIESAMKTSCQIDVQLSVSLGFASRSECESPEDALKLADERLYEYKQSRKTAAVKRSKNSPKQPKD